jgi:hypothetical protein
VNFTPTYDIQVLPSSAIQASCGGADRNFCPTNLENPGLSIDAQHATTYGHDAGTDHYATKRRLWNGWTLYDFDFQVTDQNHGTVQPLSGFMSGYDYLDLQVHWDQDGGNILTPHSAVTAYQITIYIRGPKGFEWNP